MSSTCKRIAKKMKQSNLLFPVDMYNNTLGSLIVTHYVLSEEKPEIKIIRQTWNRLKRKGLKFWLDDKDFISKALALFNLKPKYGLFCMVQSKFNILFAPYIDGQVYPIREDGIFAPTLKIGKIYPIVEETNVEE